MTLVSEEMQELAELCRNIFSNVTPVQRIQDLERQELTWDEHLWKELSQAGVLGAALPESVGGMGLGLAAVTAVVEAQGSCVAPVPLWSTMLANLVLSEHEHSFKSLLLQASEGEVRISLAFEERHTNVLSPEMKASHDGSAWILTGTKIMIPHADSLTHLLVSAQAEEGIDLFLVERESVESSIIRSTTTDRGAVASISFESTPAIRVPMGTAEFTRFVYSTFLVLSALQLGVARGALKITAQYVSEREQFGRPIGSFQSLQHQLADGQIGVDALELVLAQALHDAENNEASFSRSARVASWWAREAATDVVYTCQHVHGGIGVDIDYPIHRYFLWGKQLSTTYTNSEELLESLGESLNHDGMPS